MWFSHATRGPHAKTMKKAPRPELHTNAKEKGNIKNPQTQEI